MHLTARTAILLAILASLPALPLAHAGTTVQDGEPLVAWVVPYPAGDAVPDGDGALFVVARDEPAGAATLRSYDRDGTVLWRQPLAGGPWSAPAVGAVVALLGADGVLRAFAKADGTLLWSTDLGEVPNGFLSVVDGNALYAWVADPTGVHVAAVAHADGAVDWASRSWAVADVQAHLALTSTSLYVVSGLTDGTMWQLAVPDGTVRLSWSNPGWRTSAPRGFDGVHADVTLARAAGAASEWRVQRRWEGNGTVQWERTVTDAAACCPLVPAPLPEGQTVWLPLPSSLLHLGADGSVLANVPAQGAAVADPVLGINVLRAATSALAARLVHVRQDNAIPVHEVPVSLPVDGTSLAVFGGGMMATRAVPTRLADRVATGTLVAFGNAKTAPPEWDCPTGLDPLALGEDGHTLHWAAMDSLNPLHFIIQRAAGSGAWQDVDFVMDEDFGGPANRSWVASAIDTRFRVVPVDRIGQQGPPSNEVVTAALPPPPGPLPVLKVTLDAPHGGDEVNGTVVFRGRSFWAENATPAEVDLTMTVSPPDQTVAYYVGSMHSNGTWSLAVDTATTSDGTLQVRPDGHYIFGVGGSWQCSPDCPARTFDLQGASVGVAVANGQWATLESLELTMGNASLVEGEPVILNVTAIGRSGFRPDAAYIGVGHAVASNSSADPHVVGIGSALAGRLEILEEGGPAGFQFRITLHDQPFPTVHWSEDGSMHVEIDLRQGDRRLPLTSRDVEVHVEPSPDAQARSDRAFASWRALAQDLPPGAVVGTAAAATGALGVGVVLATEAGRYGLLKLLPAGLFSRIRGPQVLEQRRRDSIYQHIQSRPGVRFSEVSRALEIPNSALSHHVRTLQREDLVRLIRRGSHLHLFAGAGLPLAELAGLSGKLLRTVAAQPGLTQSEAARRLGVTRQALHYHVRGLHQKGLLDVTVDGRESSLARKAGVAALACPDPGCGRTFVGAGPRPCPSCGGALQALA